MTTEDALEIPEVLATKIVLVPVEKLIRHPRNPNVGDLESIVESIRENGFAEPLVVQTSTSHIIGGNHRYEAAVQLGIRKVPVVWLDVDDDRALKLLLAFNQTAKRSIYDDAILADLLKGLAVDDPAGLVGTGFDTMDLDILSAGLAPVPEPRTDSPPSTPTSSPTLCPACGHEWTPAK